MLKESRKVFWVFPSCNMRLHYRQSYWENYQEHHNFPIGASVMCSAPPMKVVKKNQNKMKTDVLPWNSCMFPFCLFIALFLNSKRRLHKCHLFYVIFFFFHFIERTPANLKLNSCNDFRWAAKYWKYGNILLLFISSAPNISSTCTVIFG